MRSRDFLADYENNEMMPQDTAGSLRVFSLGAANKGNNETSFRQVSWIIKDSQDRQTKEKKDLKR